MSSAAVENERPMRSLIPVRMDQMPWSRFHRMVILGLGTAWILDGLEIQLVASAGYAKTLGMSSAQVGLTSTIYLVGQVVGALVFGRLTDKLGRKKLFIITLAVYLIGSGLAGLAPSATVLYVFRFVAGLGIGGEYSAINSAIDELIPGKYRGRVDLAINGTYWAGAMLGAVGSYWLLDTERFAENVGWRIAFFIGPVLGLIIIYLRRHIPESPRWQLTHGHEREAEENVDRIEREVEEESGRKLEPVPQSKAIEVKATGSIPFRAVAHVFIRKYPRRSFVAFAMMVTQSFLYNAIFFSYALVLQNFYGIPNGMTGLYFFPFAIGNLIGPLVLGPLFDTLGRRKMIFGTYAIAGIVLAVSAALFSADVLTAATQTLFWCVSFFFASAGASSAYLTVSETFPIELRGQAISYFFSIGQAVGAFAPVIFGALVGNGSSRGPLTIGYYFGAAMMILGGIIALIFAFDAERKPLEDIADPLSKVTAS